MTTIDKYYSIALEDYHRHRAKSSDEPFTRQQSYSKTATIAKNIPPAVPSPPPLSSRLSPPRDHHDSVSPSPLRMMSTPAAELPNQWYFTDAEVNSTPSVLDGLPIVEERSRRAKGVNFISQAGILLKLPQLTLATASVFFHRFYMRYSMVPEKGGLHHYVRSSPSSEYYPSSPILWRLPRSKSSANLASKDPQSISRLTFETLEQNIAATSLFLATKTEENCRKTKEIVIAVAKVAQKNSNLVIDEQSKEYWRWRDNILLYEELMLELLTFDVVLDSPYNNLYQILGNLELDTNKPLRNAAWSWINDSCLTMMCLIIPPRDIAIASVYFAAKYTHERISDDEHGGAWWEREGGRADRIRKAVAIMHEFYSENPLKKTQEQSPYFKGERGEEDLDSTRRQAGDPKDESPNSISQNGHSQRSSALTAGEQPTPNGRVEPSTNGVSVKDDQHSAQGESVKSAVPATDDTPASLGDSDAKLKAAANDPTTHQSNGHTNGMTSLQHSQEKTPKRKVDVDAGESDAKRVKTSDTVEEEGELEE